MALAGAIETAAVAVAPARARRVRFLKWTLALALIAVEIPLIAPHVSRGADALLDLRWGWVIAAIACEIASIATFARLRRRLLRVGGIQVPLRKMGALTLASSAISISVPAGTAVSAAYLYRQFRRLGASAPLVAWVLAAGTVVSVMSFSVITLAGTVLDNDASISALAGAGGASIAAVLGLIALLTVVTRHPRPWVRAAFAVTARVPFVRTKPDATSVERVVEQITAITPRVRDWTLAFWFATVNWAADLACFVLCCHAVGVDRLGIGVAVLAYVAGLATTSISLLPGGLGSVDAGMLLGLTSAGVAAPLAVAGILTYRIVAYALVGLVGWAVWAVLRRNRPARAAAVNLPG